MPKISNWKPEKYDFEFVNAGVGRLRKAAEHLADEARARCPVGTISRPIYMSGPYAGQSWTARDAGALRRTIRVVEKTGGGGIEISQFNDVRVYAGNYNVFYASIVEYAGKKFMRPALAASKQAIRSILENG